jgi:hypothetical protein
MPKVGEKEFAYTDKGIAEAQAESAQTGKPMQVSDAMERSQTMYPGGGKTGYNIPKYKHGGVAPYGVLEGEQAKDEAVLKARAEKTRLKAESVPLKRRQQIRADNLRAQEMEEAGITPQRDTRGRIINYPYKKGGKVKK